LLSTLSSRTFTRRLAVATIRGRKKHGKSSVMTIAALLNGAVA
jgi:hypothetical protein